MTLFIVLLVVAFISAGIASNKGGSFIGWLIYGFFLAPIAFVHALLMSPKTAVLEKAALDSAEAKKCPFCAEVIKWEAKVCKHCGRDVMPEAERIGAQS